MTPSHPAAASTHARWATVRAVTGLDFHVLSTLLFRSWSLVAGAVTVLVVPLTLDPTEQGYYFTFASLVALQVVFELGLNVVVVQIVSQEFAFVSVDRTGAVVGDPPHIARVFSLLKSLRRWYRIAGALFFIVVGGIGTYFFNERGHLPASEWLGAWWLLTLGFAINFYLSPFLAVLEGAGEFGQVARMRMYQSMAGHASIWAALWAGAGLWSAAALSVVAAVFTLTWLRYRAPLLRGIDTAGRQIPRVKLDWGREVFPLQWRIAISWVCGYLVFNLFTPVIFARQGAVDAGRLGLALTIFSMVLTLGMSWLNAKTPDFGRLIAKRERAGLNSLFLRTLSRSWVFTLVACLVLLSLAWGIQWLGLPLSDRIAAFPVLLCIAAVTLINNVVFACAAYIRAHKREPLMAQSVVHGLLTVGALYVGSTHGVLLTMTLYLAVSALVALPWTLWLFRGYWTRAVASA